MLAFLFIAVFTGDVTESCATSNTTVFHNLSLTLQTKVTMSECHHVRWTIRMTHDYSTMWVVWDMLGCCNMTHEHDRQTNGQKGNRNIKNRPQNQLHGYYTRTRSFLQCSDTDEWVMERRTSSGPQKNSAPFIPKDSLPEQVEDDSWWETSQPRITWKKCS